MCDLGWVLEGKSFYHKLVHIFYKNLEDDQLDVIQVYFYIIHTIFYCSEVNLDRDIYNNVHNNFFLKQLLKKKIITYIIINQYQYQ